MSDAGHAGGPASEGGSLGLDERAELERLRAEVTRLHTDRAAPARRPHAGWRSPVAVVLIVVGCLLAPVSVLAVWLVIVIVAALLVVLGLIELLGSRPPAQPATL